MHRSDFRSGSGPVPCILHIFNTLRAHGVGKIRKSSSRYLPQNAAIWLADEVLRYRDHHTSRCQDDISWHLITQQSKRHNVKNGSRIVARNGESTHIYYERVNFIACFWIICWFLQTLNYRGSEKYVLVLVQCHDGMITNSINLVCVLHSSSTRARPNRFVSFVIIASWRWNRTRT